MTMYACVCVLLMGVCMCVCVSVSLCACVCACHLSGPHHVFLLLCMYTHGGVCVLCVCVCVLVVAEFLTIYGKSWVIISSPMINGGQLPTNQLHDINYCGVLDHASHATLMSCNYSVCTC